MIVPISICHLMLFVAIRCHHLFVIMIFLCRFLFVVFHVLALLIQFAQLVSLVLISIHTPLVSFPSDSVIGTNPFIESYPFPPMRLLFLNFTPIGNALTFLTPSIQKLHPLSHLQVSVSRFVKLFVCLSVSVFCRFFLLSFAVSLASSLCWSSCWCKHSFILIPST